MGKCVGEDNPLWKGGVSFLPYCFKFNPRRRRAVRKFFDDICICCGSLSVENIRKSKGGSFRQSELDVHHVYHNKDEGCNGLPFNLVPLCRSCHSKELHHEDEYKLYINNILKEGFKWGIWSEQEYIEKVMYPE
jgi:hypothetical protein